MNPFDVTSCGCGGTTKRTEEEIERIVRKVEEERKNEPIPVVIPVRKVEADPEPIPVENWPVRKKEEVEVDR